MYILISAAALVIILLFIPLKIHLVFSLDKKIFRFFIPLPFHKKLDLAKKPETPFSLASQTISYALKKLKIERFHFRIKSGTGDAFLDVMISAAVRIFFSGLVLCFRAKLEKSDLYISVQPDMEKTSLEFDVDCIFSFRSGNIIWAILMELFYRIKKSVPRRKEKTYAKTDTGNNGNNAA